MTESMAIQDSYPEDVAHCYGCGRLNEVGHQITTRPVGDTTITEFTPEPHHTAVPGYAYGGLIASIIDCHSTGSAAIFAMQERDIRIGTHEALRFVTAHLEVDYLLPTPLKAFRLEGRLVEVKDRKVVVDTELSVDGRVTAKGSAVLIEIPQSFVPPGS
jgi:acyl-coenzyme A thioesterase PaaI-like protein